MRDAPRWWEPDAHAERRPRLLARNRIVGAWRAFFAKGEFVEVEVPALQVSPGNETHLHAFATDWRAPGGATVRYHLQTSPEFACKKLLAAGETRLFTLAHVFRNGELGALHAPEFTMLEWYRAREPYRALMDDCAALVRLAADAAGSSGWSFRGIACDPRAEPERLSVAEAFARHAGLDLFELGDAETFARAARGVGLRTAPDDTWSDVFSRVLSDRIEPQLGRDRPVILYDYPVSEAALARPKADDPRLAERFELYACGVELANAFGELTDPVEQRRRFVADMDEKQRIYGERYPLDESFLAALGRMPEASGAALGVDRLVMLATGASRVEQVMWAPLEGPAAHP